MAKAIIRATDNHGEKKSIEVGCSINLNGDVATQFNTICRQKKGRTAIIEGLKLYFGDAKLELIVDGKIIAEGTISFNAFSGHGDVQTKMLREPRKAA